MSYLLTNNAYGGYPGNPPEYRPSEAVMCSKCCYEFDSEDPNIFTRPDGSFVCRECRVLCECGAEAHRDSPRNFCAPCEVIFWHDELGDRWKENPPARAAEAKCQLMRWQAVAELEGETR